MKTCSVIIPAYNEESLIGECLDSVIANKETFKGDLEIIVIANACTDSTTEIVRKYDGIKLVETEIPGKPNALNLSDGVANFFPRIYIDADLTISDNLVSEIFETLSAEKIKLASSSLKLNSNGVRNRLVKDYFNVWLDNVNLRNMTAETSRFGGVYALSEEGRRRFDKFPNVLAEDSYIKNLFSVDERKVNNNCFYYMKPSKTTMQAINQRMRWCASNLQLTKEHFYKDGLKPKSPLQYIQDHITSYLKTRGMREIGKFFHFMTVYSVALVCGYLKYHFGDMNHWNGDGVRKSSSKDKIYK